MIIKYETDDEIILIMEKEMNEKSIEAKVIKYAKEKGVIAIKLQTNAGRGLTGYPDRLFMKNRHSLFIEFKAPGKHLTAVQKARKNELNREGFNVFVVSETVKGLAIIDWFSRIT